MNKRKIFGKCEVSDCEREAQTRCIELEQNLCLMHYKRWSRGAPLEGPLRPSILLPADHPVYKAWVNMKTRCSNPNATQWKYYGGRGITYCERWELFENFHADMFSTWQEGLSLDRRNTNGNYEPSNCRWIPRGMQSMTRNRRGYLESQ